MAIDKNQTVNISPNVHKPGTRFLATASFGFSQDVQECKIIEWAPSGQFIHLAFPVLGKSMWSPVESFKALEILNDTDKNGPRAAKAPDNARPAKRHTAK